MTTGSDLPVLATAVPGPASRELAARLARVECRNTTRLAEPPPIFWAEARGANVVDADGNIFIDLTAGFGVALTGHAQPDVARSVAEQMARLPHALGDVQPAVAKVTLLERLLAICPTGLDAAILANTGAEAVEAALKTAVIATGNPGIIAFDGAYHGLTYGALATTHRAHFRTRFEAQLFGGVRFAPFAHTLFEPGVDAALHEVRHLLRAAMNSAHPVGCIIVEPVQGRAGIRVAAPGFLEGLRRICDDAGCLLIFDEVYSGIGRTGRWFAADHWGVLPDIVTVGKALGGGLPISAAIASSAVMNAWPPSAGEAIHTSTFLGNPVACAAAAAQLDAIRRDRLLDRATRTGVRIGARLNEWTRRFPHARHDRGLGLMRAVTHPRAADIADSACRLGIIILAEGPRLDTLAFTPPAIITDQQIDHALDRIEDIIARLEP